MRGKGVPQAKNSLCDKTFRRMTADKIQRASLAGKTVFVQFPQGPWWDQAWVFPKRQAAIEGQARAQSFYHLLVSTSVAEVKQKILLLLPPCLDHARQSMHTRHALNES